MVAERHRTGWDHAGPSKTRQLCKGKALLHWETQVCLKNAGSFDAAPASPRAPARRRPCLRRPKRARRLRNSPRSFSEALYIYGRENRGRQGLLLKPLGGLPPGPRGPGPGGASQGSRPSGKGGLGAAARPGGVLAGPGTYQDVGGTAGSPSTGSARTSRTRRASERATVKRYPESTTATPTAGISPWTAQR